MKKLVTLAAILAVSSVAIATTPAPQETTQAQQTFGSMQQDEGKHRDGKHKREKGDKHGKGDKFEPRGGFYDESVVVKTLADAQKSENNTPFSIEGYIVKQTSKEDFVFKDNAGTELPVEISKKAWRGETITPTDKVTIRGKVDKELIGLELEVKEIVK